MHWLLMAGLLVLSQPAWSAAKTDVVVLKNGDHLTGEIKKIEKGILTLKTDALGTVDIDWVRIAQIKTDQLLEIELADGQRRYGRIPDMAPSGTLALQMDNDKKQMVEVKNIPIDNLVHATPLAQGNFFDRIDGHISAGINTASANDSRQYTVSADVTLKDQLRSWQATYDGAHDESEGNSASNRSALNLIQRRYLGPVWFWAAGAGLTSNDELGLDLRSQIGGGFGRYLQRDQSHEASVLAGIYRNHEEFADGTSQTSDEGLLSGTYTFFHTTHPEVDISTQLNIYPSLTISGRVRADANVSVRYELIKDLYYELSYIANWDNKPQSLGAQKNDWSIVSSLGYKF